MSLKTTFDRLARLILKKFASFAEEIDYDHYSGVQTYDVSTDAMTRTKTSYTFKVIPLKYEEDEQNPSFSATATYTSGAVQIQKMHILFARKDVAEDFDASTGDTFVRPNGEIWRVVKDKHPPGASIFKLEVERGN